MSQPASSTASSSTALRMAAVPGDTDGVPCSAASPVGHPFCALCDGVPAALSPDPMPDPMPAAVRISLRAGQQLFVRGAMTDAVYVVHRGIVKETVPTPDGGECVVRLAMGGDVVGLPALPGQTQTHGATVMHAGTACRIPAARIEAQRRRDPAVAERLFRDWQGALDDADCLLANLGHGAARARLARLLLDSALQPDEPLQLRLGDAADVLAITPVSVARLLGDFRREGLLAERQRRLELLDRGRLRQIARSAKGREARPARRRSPGPTPSRRRSPRAETGRVIQDALSVPLPAGNEPASQA